MSRCLKLCSACVGMTCDGNFEIVDENLAARQRKRGSEVSGSEIRRHPEVKREACTVASPTNETTRVAYTSC